MGRGSLAQVGLSSYSGDPEGEECKRGLIGRLFEPGEPSVTHKLLNIAM